ncbi:MAG: hypothetical protein JW395_0496 [Nitrospira sp.]|nr:hypothetical protein [Nitrospira sp.]
MALRTPGCEYIHNFGMLQYTYDIPSWAMRPGGPPNYLPYPGGDNALSMPDSAFDPLDLFGTVIPGDGIHPSAAAHKVLLRNAVEQTYLGLYASELICPEGEGVEEGSVEGVIEGTPEGTVEGITEGTTEGVAEGALEGSVEGTIEGVAEGTLEGAIEGSPEGNIEGTPEGVVEGVVEGSTEGTIEGVVEGSLEGTPEGSVEGTPEGTPEGTVEGSVEGSAEGSNEGSLEGEGTADGEDPTEGEGVQEGEASNEGTTEGEGTNTPGHAADYDGDGKIGLAEILRLIQFYNFANGFGCGNGEDGFALGSEDKTCPFHSSDYTEPRWIITLSELLRSVQLFNMNGYWPCPEASEDGFCAGETPGK